MPAISEPIWGRSTCAVGVAIPQRIGWEHLHAQADLLAQTFGARRAPVDGAHIGALVLRLQYGDALEAPFTLDLDKDANV